MAQNNTHSRGKSWGKNGLRTQDKFPAAAFGHSGSLEKSICYYFENFCFKDLIILLFYVYDCFAHVTVNQMCAVPSDQKGLWMFPRSGITNGSKSPCGYRESNVGPLED